MSLKNCLFNFHFKFLISNTIELKIRPLCITAFFVAMFLSTLKLPADPLKTVFSHLKNRKKYYYITQMDALNDFFKTLPNNILYK